MDEQILIEAAQRGDLSAFNQLVLKYQAVMYNVACRILGDQDAAADATQDAVFSAFRAIGTFRNGSLKSWLLRIVTNRCYDELRKKRSHPTSSVDDPLIDPERLPFFADAAEVAGEYVDRQRLSAVLQAAILSLPPHHRTVVVLADIQGLGYQEVADVLHISCGTVKSRLSRARASLRDALQANHNLLPERYRRLDRAAPGPAPARTHIATTNPANRQRRPADSTGPLLVAAFNAH